nr:choice-of-anchor R domain-containing protein [Pseudanabaena sp. FACHB-1998]
MIGNLPSNDGGGGANISAGVQQTAVGFTLPVGVGYQLDNIVLRLSTYNTDTDGDVALLQIYADATKTSTSPLGATLQTVFFTNPTSNSDAASDFTFTPTANFTFAADTRYWLLVDATSGNYAWFGSFPAVAPTGVATFDSYRSSNNNGGSYFNNANRYSFQVNAIDATPVPFDFSPQFGIAVLGGGWLLRKKFKKSK